MKKQAKFLSSILAVATAFSTCSAAFSASAATGTFLTGDLNLDTVVDTIDAQIALSIYTDAISGLKSNAVTKENEQGDINLDGSITIEDAESILRYYCQTLVGGKPLWADFRTVSKENGNNFNPISVSDPDETSKDIIPEFGLDGMFIEVGCVSGKPGETVTVPVYISGVPKLIAYQLKVKHDLPLILTDITTDIDKNEECSQKYETAFANPNAGTNYGISTWANDKNVTLQDGYVVAKFSYVIPENAVEGTHYSVSVDSSYTEFIMEGSETDTKIEDYLPKDNGDGTYTFTYPNSYKYTSLSGVVTVI